jgi:hypothetical protein
MRNGQNKFFKRNILEAIWLQILIIIFLTLLIFFAVYYQPGKSCTIFTVVQDEYVIFGNSEDQHNPNPVLGIYPPSKGNYGSIHFGTRSADGKINFEGAVNDQGLAWDVNSTPKSKLDPDPNPGKPYFLGEDNYLTRITKEAATVEEAISIAQLYNFGDTLSGQYHIADASGDAVVISAGSDGKVTFTRKEPEESYLLSTNFNLAQPEKGPVDYRWQSASRKLNGLEEGESLSPDYARDLLEAVHLETLTSYTLYSNVLDLRNDRIYLNYMSQFDETAVIDMEKEFAKGERVVEMREFFTAETAAAGDAAYQSFAVRFQAFKLAVITIAFLLIIGTIYWINLKLRKLSPVQVRMNSSEE